MIIAYLLAGGVGIVLGLTGAGGGILALPVLVYCLDLDIVSAGPIALIAVGLSAWVGSFYAYIQRLLDIKAALLMASAGALVTPLGQLTAKILPYEFVLLLFVVVMLIVAIRMWRQSFRHRGGRG